MKKHILRRIISGVVGVIATGIFSISAFATSNDAEFFLNVVKEHSDIILEKSLYVEDAEVSGLLPDYINIDDGTVVPYTVSGIEYDTANLVYHQNLSRMFSALSKITGDEKYKEVMKEQFRRYLDKYTDNNGLPYWGGHRAVDINTGQICGEANYHEFKNAYIDYDTMYEVDPEATIQFIEAYWNAHIYDWKTLESNRHGTYNKNLESDIWNQEWSNPEDPFFEVEGLPFPSAALPLVYAASKYKEFTGESAPLTWGKRFFELALATRHPVTGLTTGQFGTLYTGDRAYLQFGKDFGDVAREAWCLYRVSENNGVVGSTLLNQMYLCEEMGEHEMAMEFAEICKNYYIWVYDKEHHAVKSMFADGTEAIGYIPESGYYGGLPGRYMDVYEETFPTASYAYKLIESPEIWDAMRDMGIHLRKLGDIGTAPGKNVALNMNTDSVSTDMGVAMMTLYEISGCEDYYELAKKIGKNIVEKLYVNGFFVTGEDVYSAKIGRFEPYYLLALAAYEMGVPELCPIHTLETAFRFHWTHDGYIRQYDEKVRDTFVRVEPTSISLSDDALVMKTGEHAAFSDVVDEWSMEAIDIMQVKGIMDGYGDNRFAPHDSITRAEFLAALNKMGVFPQAEYENQFKDISADDWYANIFQGAYDNKILKDTEMMLNGMAEPNKAITREEAAALIVHSVRVIAPSTVKSGKWYHEKYADADEIGRWAESYVDSVGTMSLMQGDEQNRFNPKGNITREEAAVLLSRLDAKASAPTIEATIYPENATSKVLTYTSSNPEIVSVSDGGVLTAIAPGSAVITVSAYNGVNAQCQVTVNSVDKDALSSLRVDGATIDRFDPDTYKYTYHCAVGTVEVPRVTASAFDGEVTVEHPESLPGTVTIKSGSRTYEVKILADRMVYELNEDFEKYRLGEPGYKEQLDLGYPFVSPTYNQLGGHIPIVPVEREDEQGGQCLYMPVDTTAQKGRQLSYSLKEPILLGPAADNLKLIIEADIKFDHKTTQNTDLQLRTMVGSAMLIRINDSVFLNNATDAMYDCSGDMGQFFTIKIVIDKKNRLFDMYVNDKLVSASNRFRDPEATLATGVIFQPGHNSKSQTWLDNYKIYTMAAEMAAPIVDTGEGEVVPEFETMDITFDDYDMLKGINGQDGWTTPVYNMENSLHPVTVEKRSYTFGIEDKMLYLPAPDKVNPQARTATIPLSGPVELGINSNGKKFVLEYDFCVGGNSAGMSVALTNGAGTNLLYAVTTGATYRYQNGNSGDYKYFYENSAEVKKFIHAKFVVDTQKCTVDIYKNDSLIGEDVPLYGSITQGKIEKLKINALNTTTQPFSIDNIKMYYQD